MKTTLYILLCLLSLSRVSLRGAETNNASLSIDLKMLDIDINLSLAFYEKVQKQLMDLRFQEALADAESRTDEEKKEDARMSRRAEVLSGLRNQLILQLRDLARRRSDLAKAANH
jgi:hypothetical protein